MQTTAIEIPTDAEHCEVKCGSKKVSEVEQGIAIAEFWMDSVPQRVAQVGDLFAPLLQARPRYSLEVLM